MLFYGILGTILGGRLGYVLFYKFGDYLAAPWKIFYVWEGGMSFHGGFLGVVIALAWFARSRRQNWLAITDFIAPLVPLGLAGGRIGNFINAELWGRADRRAVGDGVSECRPRAAPPLAALRIRARRRACCSCMLWWYSPKPRPRGAVSAVFLIGYGVFRFGVEFTREPDSFLGLLALGLTMGSGCRCRWSLPAWR